MATEAIRDASGHRGGQQFRGAQNDFAKKFEVYG